jgi:hypothetical protein
LKLYSGIPIKNTKEGELVRLTAFRRLLDDKLKQLVEDPRITQDITNEIIKTAAELKEINGEINTLLAIEKYPTLDNPPSIALYQQKLAAARLLTDAAEKEIAFQELTTILEALKREKEIRDLRSLRALHEVLTTKAIEANAISDYRYSRVGKVSGMLYTVSQIIIMTFLGLLLFSTLGTSALALGLIIPIMVLGVPATGVSNWWLFRGLVAKTFIILRNLLFIPTDVSLTSWQLFKLACVAVICAVSGFIAAYAFYILWIGLAPALLLNPFVMGFIVLPIFIGSVIAVATYFFKAAYEPTLRGRVFKDIWEFYLVITEYDKVNIESKLEKIKADAIERYKHYYQGQALDNKVEEILKGSTAAVILNKKLQRLAEGLDIKAHARWTFFWIVFLIPGMIGGIIVTQLLTHADLSSALYKVGDYAELLSWAICTMAGLAYTPVLVSGGARCVVDLKYGEEKVAGDEKSEWEKAKFQWVRGWNASLNWGEAIVGYILKKAENIADFAHEAYKLSKSGWDIALGSYLTTTAGGASFLSNTIQGPPTHYDTTRDEACQKAQDAKQILQTCLQDEQEADNAEAAFINVAAGSTVLIAWQATHAQKAQPASGNGYSAAQSLIVKN